MRSYGVFLWVDRFKRDHLKYFKAKSLHAGRYTIAINLRSLNLHSELVYVSISMSRKMYKFIAERIYVERKKKKKRGKKREERKKEKIKQN